MAILTETPRLATYNRDALAQIADEFVRRYCDAPSPVVPPRYWCRDCGLTFTDAESSIAHHDATGHVTTHRNPAAPVVPREATPKAVDKYEREYLVHVIASAVEKGHPPGTVAFTDAILAAGYRRHTAPAAGTAEPVNQCDGCRRGMPLRNGVHYKPDSTGANPSWPDMISCTAHLYRAPLSMGAPSRADVEKLPRYDGTECDPRRDYLDRAQVLNLLAAPSSGAPEVTDEMVERAIRHMSANGFGEVTPLEARRIITAALRPEGK